MWRILLQDKKYLGKYIIEPPGVPAILPFRIIALLTSASRPAIRAEILQEFCQINSTLRVIFGTTAFGLGVDCQCIERVINWRTPGSLEEQVQESGRAGKDGNDSEAILYYTKTAGRHVSKEM